MDPQYKVDIKSDLRKYIIEKKLKQKKKEEKKKKAAERKKNRKAQKSEEKTTCCGPNSGLMTAVIILWIVSLGSLGTGLYFGQIQYKKFKTDPRRFLGFKKLKLILGAF